MEAADARSLGRFIATAAAAAAALAVIELSPLFY